MRVTIVGTETPARGPATANVAPGRTPHIAPSTPNLHLARRTPHRPMAYQLDTWLWLPLPREDVFRFFADAHNLERITPPFLRFQVQEAAPIAMRQDLRINYRLRLHGLPLTWQTAITVWDPPTRFVDSQLRGPYRRWVHTHTFEDQDGGTLVRDQVVYAMHGPAFLSGIVNRLFVAPDVTRIFEYRHRALNDILKPPAPARFGPVTVRPHREADTGVRAGHL